jgi:hypothetical protein
LFLGGVTMCSLWSKFGRITVLISRNHHSQGAQMVQVEVYNNDPLVFTEIAPLGLKQANASCAICL